MIPKISNLEKNAESPVTSNKKKYCTYVMREIVLLTQKLFVERIILQAFQKQNYYHRIKYI